MPASGHTVSTHRVVSESVLLATGGVPSANNQSMPEEYRDRTVWAPEVLTEAGVVSIQRRLRGSTGQRGRKVVIIGGSHSAFSAAWVLLHKCEESPRWTPCADPAPTVCVCVC